MKLREIREKLALRRVGIAGAGGLGSNCAVSLARCGVGTIVIADFDIVDKDNLNRQYYFADQTGMLKTEALETNIRKIDDQIKVIIFSNKLDPINIPEIFKDCDVVVEAFDNNLSKEMIIETMADKMPGVPLVIGSGLAGWGSNNNIRSRQIDDYLYICGDESSETNDNKPPLAPRVGIVANMQANTVIEILLGQNTDNLDDNENIT